MTQAKVIAIDTAWQLIMVGLFVLILKGFSEAWNLFVVVNVTMGLLGILVWVALGLSALFSADYEPIEDSEEPWYVAMVNKYIQTPKTPNTLILLFIWTWILVFVARGWWGLLIVEILYLVSRSFALAFIQGYKERWLLKPA